MGDLLARLFAARGWGAKLQRLGLDQAWRRVAGDTVGERTCVLRLSRGVLTVGVSDPVLLQELRAFRGKHLVAALQREVGAACVRRIQFRLR